MWPPRRYSREQQRGDQVAADHEEDVDAEEAARHPADPGVVEEHRQHRDRPQGVDARHVGEASVLRPADRLSVARPAACVSAVGTPPTLGPAMTLVVKLGSSIVAADDGELRADVLDSVCEQVAALERGGERVVMVTSGAIARGMRLMGLPVRPRAMDELQAASAVGQGDLFRAYESGSRGTGPGRLRCC